MLKKLPNRLSISDKSNYIFQYKNNPISNIRTGLKKGCEDAGIPYGRKIENGFTFHDLRRTAKTIARKAGVDKNIRMVILDTRALMIWIQDTTKWMSQIY